MRVCRSDGSFSNSAFIDRVTRCSVPADRDAPPIPVRISRASAHPGLPEPFRHASPHLHANLLGLALNLFKALGGGRILVVLNLDDLGDAVVVSLCR